MSALLPEFEYYADLIVHPVGPGPFGNRLQATVTGGEVSGDRLKGSFVGAGADWLLAGPDGFGRLDVRATMQTVDGAFIYFQYFGLVELTPAILALMEGGDTPTDFADQYFFTSPRLETGDERYSWVNQTMFVGEGRLLPGPRVDYRVYRVAHDG
jgi:hypothetical protein